MLSTKEVLYSYIEQTKKKVTAPILNTVLLSVLAGVFIAFAGVGCCLSTSVAGKFVGACVFPVGIIMVVLGGAELFTGDCLLTIPLLTRDVKLKDTALTLLLVYVGNLIGAVLIAVLVVYSGALESVKDAVIYNAIMKASLPFGTALLRGILCNILVCVAVLMSMSAQHVAGKILALFPPILVFVIAGFEHSVANMYFLPAGIFTALKYGITDGMSTMLSGLYANLIPVTLGNIIGGVAVGMIYKVAVYSRHSRCDNITSDID